MLVPLFIPGQKNLGAEMRSGVFRRRQQETWSEEEEEVHFFVCQIGREKKSDFVFFANVPRDHQGRRRGMQHRLGWRREGGWKWRRREKISGRGASFAKLTQLIVGLRELEKGLWGPPPPLSYPHPPSQGDPPAFAHGDAKTQPSATLAKRGGRDLWGHDLCCSTKFHTGKYLHQSSVG